MKTLIQNLSAFILVLAVFSVAFSQDIEIDLTFTGDTVIYPFEGIETISELTMDGDVEFYSDTSLVRLILEDENGYQYMIFETYPLISSGSIVSADDYCDETCALNECNPYSLIVQVIEADFLLKDLYYDTEPKQNAEDQRYEAKRAKDSLRIEIMNEKVLIYGMNWTCADNGLVELYYEQKKNIFGNGYNMLGYDYYHEGGFEFLGHRDYPRVNPNFVRSFDWRNRHGANDSSSNYWDGDSCGTGWLTKEQDQRFCSSCWAFSSVGTVEAIANLYASHHINYDLSEQYILSCSDAGTCGGGGEDSALLYIKYHGTVTENCFPYYGLDPSTLPCTSNLNCDNPDPIVKITDTLYFRPADYNYDSLRIKLITKGPLTFTYVSGQIQAHSVVLIGFEFDQKDSTLWWIIKNSNTNWGNKGFGKLKLENYMRAFAVVPPVFHNDTALDVECHDYDLDGYCFWGIGEKPKSCDSCNCYDIEDCDDSNPMVGGYDEFYNCKCLVEYDSTIIYISSDTTWNDSLIVRNPIIIDSGACLTISAVAQIHPDVKITVGKGGKLVLDGGKLTNACPELWEGIDVLGTDTSQYYSQFFGVLEIKEGGTIENARVAVSNYCKPCEDQDAGGIINADDGIFRNNQVAFEFAPFRNIYQGTERSYLGSFERCLFMHDEYLQNYEEFRYFIKLNGVNGITIKGCEFICDTMPLNPDSERTLKYNSGIYSTGSHFSVDVACTEDILPCPGFVPSVFKGLNYGIYALGITGTELISVKKSNFINNRTGIYLSGVNYASVVQDTFDVFLEKKSADTLCGLYLDYCTGYQVEENDFRGNYFYQEWESPNECVGIVINNSGEEYNEIYNNRFDSLFIGTLAQNVNRDDKEGVGLEILCNDYTNGYFDISVTSYDTVGISGIANNQGSGGSDWTSPANNTFSYSEPVNNNNVSDYFNECENLIYWYLDNYDSAHIEPLYYSIPEIIPQFDDANDHYYQKDSCCPSSFSQGGGELLLENRSKMNAYLAKSDSISYLINLFEDGGNTYELRIDILTSSQEDANNLYEMLLAYSPYLSDSVMVASAEIESVISSDMLTDILSENPQAAKSDTVQFALDNRMDELSEEQRIAIDQGWFITGELEKMQSTYAYYNRRQSNAFYTLARTFKSDNSIV